MDGSGTESGWPFLEILIVDLFPKVKLNLILTSLGATAKTSLFWGFEETKWADLLSLKSGVEGVSVGVGVGVAEMVVEVFVDKAELSFSCSLLKR